MKKYVLLLNETKETGNRKIVYRIKSIVPFGNIRAGQRGGFVESEANLSHEGKCWISGDAVVIENAVVKDNAFVSGSVLVRENAIVSGNSRILGGGAQSLPGEKIEISGSARICDFSVVKHGVAISQNAIVRDHSKIENQAKVFGRADIGGSSFVTGKVKIQNDAKVSGNACVRGNAIVRDKAVVTDCAIISGEAVIMGESVIDGTKKICRGVIKKSRFSGEVA